MLSAKCRTVLVFGLFLSGCREGQITSEWKKSMDEPLLVDTSSAINYGYMLLGKHRISKYDHLVKKYSRRYGFDWRLISAQIFAESGFRETAQSHVGALGLMQIMPRTAKHLGVDPRTLLRPEQNIQLGIYYDYKMYCLWKDKAGRDRYRFAFASYNAGRRKVLRAQKKAEAKRYKEVKKHLPGETQCYVRKIFRQYTLYKKVHF